MWIRSSITTSNWVPWDSRSYSKARPLSFLLEQISAFKGSFTSISFEVEKLTANWIARDIVKMCYEMGVSIPTCHLEALLGCIRIQRGTTKNDVCSWFVVEVYVFPMIWINSDVQKIFWISLQRYCNIWHFIVHSLFTSFIKTPYILRNKIRNSKVKFISFKFLSFCTNSSFSSS